MLLSTATQFLLSTQLGRMLSLKILYSFDGTFCSVAIIIELSNRLGQMVLIILRSNRHLIYANNISTYSTKTKYNGKKFSQLSGYQ